MLNPISNRPPLVALVYRFGKGCKQYPFGTLEELASFTARHPYKNEILRVMPVNDRGILGDKMMPAIEAEKFVRESRERASC